VIYVSIFYQVSNGNVQGPVHAYISIPGGRTCYLSELKAGEEVSVADQNGQLRTAIVGRVKIETRPLILVEAKVCMNIPLASMIYGSITNIVNYNCKKLCE
jgi:3-dehydroquinate synthase class II